MNIFATIVLFSAVFFLKNTILVLTFATMKIFALIMAIVVITLSCTPCMDGAFAMSNAKAAIGKSTSNEQSDHKDGDTCSPFCSCNCCTGLASLLSPVKLTPIIRAESKQYASFLPSAVIEISLPVWQPPQLS